MTRILSALVLLPLVLGTIWLAPPVGTLLLAELVLLFAFAEYVDLAGRLGARIPKVVTALATAATCAAIGLRGAVTPPILMTAVVAIGALTLGSGRRGSDALHDVSASLFAPLYLGLPLGAMAAIREDQGREGLLLLMLVVMISDTGQYYGGRLLGRTPLAPAISPKKTVEGAVSGLVVASAAMAIIGQWWMPEVVTWALALLGATVVMAGIAGDLFESLLKRGAGLKDTSTLIPGHGGVLDRIDSLLFAAPVYYVFVAYWGRAGLGG